MFCAVPVNTPVVPDGLETPVASAGPYYLAAHTEAAAVLKRNPNYGGVRPQHLDAIVSSSESRRGGRRPHRGRHARLHPPMGPRPLTGECGGARGRLSVPPDAHLTAGGPLPRFQHRPAALRRRPPASCRPVRARPPGARRLDPEGPALVATRLIPPNMPGFDTEPLYPLRGDLRTARKLAGGLKATAVVYMFDDKSAFSTALREQLAAIGIRMKVLPAVNADFGPGGKFLEKALRSDLIWGGEGIETGDLASYLERLFLSPKEEDELARILKLPLPERDERAVALARRVEQQVTLRRLRQQSTSGAPLAPAWLHRPPPDVPGRRPGRALPEGLRRLTARVRRRGSACTSCPTRTSTGRCARCPCAR